jgi:peroxiredoxin
MPSPQDREAALFALPAEKPAAEGAAFLDGACHDNSALRQRLEALLAAHEQPDTLLERVGESGCGVVYVAEQTEPVRRRVALKVIKLGWTPSRWWPASRRSIRRWQRRLPDPGETKILSDQTAGASVLTIISCRGRHWMGRSPATIRAKFPMTTRVIPAFLAAALLLLLGTIPGAARSAANFNLVDQDDLNHELYRAPGKAVVLFFTGNGCPVARKSAPKLNALKEKFEGKGVTFWVVDSYAGDTTEEIRKERRDIGLWGTVFLVDRKQAVALALGVERTSEVVAINTKDWNIFYRGAIDDQLAEGAEKQQATENYLDDALSGFLDGKEITTKYTRPKGCRFSFATVAGPLGLPDYATQIAPLLKKNCVECHRKDGIGPWSMNSHKRVANYADMIEEVLLTRRMPPWDPHPDYGVFLTPHQLDREETQTLLTWVKGGAPRGPGPDPLEEPLPPLPEWRLGKPDTILALPEPQKVPATGIVDYRYVEIASPFTNDVWLSAMDIKPGNPKVVHHVILYVKSPGESDDDSGHGRFFVGWAPGASALHYPDGVAKRLPAHSKLTLELHYTTCGSEQEDTSEVALYLASGPQERNAETRQAIQLNLDIPPGESQAGHIATYAFKKPATIYGLFPHMHFRGKWMRYELLLPNGKRETILHVPRYDFQWQLSYYLKEPLHVPAGSWLLVSGAFDNSAANPANPNPNRPVVFGKQSWDEMFIGFFEAADDPEIVKTASR